MTEVKNGEMKINVSGLRGKKVMVATPMYGGLGNTMYISSMLQLQDQFLKLGITMQHCFMMNESLIDRARNGLVHEFLTVSDAEYLLFIDADIQFRPDDILAMMYFDKDVICAPYPKKHVSWPVIIEAVKAGIEDIPTLEKLVGEYVFTSLNDAQAVDKIVKVSEAGTGLMLVKRHVFQKMKDAYPENYYISDASRDVGSNKEMHAYFRTAIVDNRYLSEDYYFCHKWREMGGDVWLFPWAEAVHYGTYGFKGSVGTFIDALHQIRESRNNG